MAVVEAFTLVSQLDATLVEDGLKHLGAVALDGRVESAVTGITHTLTDTDECVPCLIQVIGTTGWNGILTEVRDTFLDAGTPMIYASNFSLGVNALEAAVKKAGQMLKGNGYTPSIEEIHHIHKLDAPSGTAITIGKIIEESLGEKPEISSVREGEVPGIHTVTLDSSVDKITLRHEAYSREGLAKGAVVAALLTEGLKGVHEFSELL